MRKTVLGFLVSAAIAASAVFGAGANSKASATTNMAAGESAAQRVRTFKVSNAQQFLEALGPDRAIELAPGKYDLSEYDPHFGKNMGKASKLKLGNDVYWSQENDGGQLILNGIKNLTIRGMGKDRSSEIIVDPRYVFVMEFVNCAGITIEGLTAGHSQSGHCLGGVFKFKGSSVIKINDTNMYGCGTYGLELSDVKLMDVTNCQIYECTYGIMTVQGGQDITFRGCTFRDNKEFSLIEVSGGTRSMLFENCTFSNNRGSRMFEVGGGPPVFVTDSTFQGNSLESGIQGSNNVQFNAGCTFDETEEAEGGMEEFWGDHGEEEDPANTAMLWKNGAASAQLTDGNYDAGSHSVYVSGKDVYVAGYERNGTYTSVATLWKNGSVHARLTDGAFHSEAFSVCASGNDVYVAGHVRSAGYNDVPTVWKNGSVHASLTSGEHDASASSVFVSGKDVYVAGYESNGDNRMATLWKNGKLHARLTDGGSSTAAAMSVFVSGNDVYAAGYENDGNNRVAMLWKNGKAHARLTDGEYDATALSVYVSANDVYVAGFAGVGNDKHMAVIWKNGKLHARLTDPENWASAQSVFVSGNDVYAAGWELQADNKTATLWKNGKVQARLTGKNINSAATSVFVSGNDAYVAGYGLFKAAAPDFSVERIDYELAEFQNNLSSR
jgi:hypothetical protein